jgi:hypothetical protein
MTNHEKHIGALLTAELQFRLASAVRLASTLGTQPLELPTKWSHGRHTVEYEEIALRPDQADYAADFLLRSATYQMAVTIRNAVQAHAKDPKTSDDPNVLSAYQIGRMIRNSFTHEPISPIWSIDEDCRDKVFEIPGVISLNTRGLNGTSFDWRHYGGPLALFRLCRYVRHEILKDEKKPRQPFPPPASTVHQLGNLILQKVDKLPEGAVPVERLPDGSIPLGDGHFIPPAPKDQIV